MRIFKAYFLILNKYKGTVFIFFAVFMSLSLIMAKVNGGGGASSFQQDSLDIAVVDEDQGEFSGQIREYFGTHNQVTEMKMDQDKIADALYWRKLDYVLVIPEGTDEVLSKGEVPELSCMKVPDCFDSAYFEAALQMYLQKMTALTGNGISLREAGQKLTALQKKETKVHMASFVNKRQGDMSTRFFLVCSISVYCGWCVRNRSGAASAESQGGTGTDGMQLYADEEKSGRDDGSSACLWGRLVSVCACGSSRYIRRQHSYRSASPWFAVNIFTMLLFGLSLGFFAGMVAKTDDAINGIVNVLSLVLCFLGGIFVPRQFFGAGVQKVAKTFPTYWYVVNNESIGAMKTVSHTFVKNILTQSMVSLGYALVIFAVTLVIVSARRTSES